jgi:hypothetical protein
MKTMGMAAFENKLRELGFDPKTTERLNPKP